MILSDSEGATVLKPLPLILSASSVPDCKYQRIAIRTQSSAWNCVLKLNAHFCTHKFLHILIAPYRNSSNNKTTNPISFHQRTHSPRVEECIGLWKLLRNRRASERAAGWHRPAVRPRRHSMSPKGRFPIANPCTLVPWGVQTQKPNASPRVCTPWWQIGGGVM